MNKNWGKKRVCPGCSVRYYDLKNPTPVCPKCGTAAELLSFSKTRKRSSDFVSMGVEEETLGLEEDTETIDLDTDEDSDFSDDLHISVETSGDEL